MKSIVLLSGGVDSATCLVIARKMSRDGYVLAVSFDYKQRHSYELECAKQLAKLYADEHIIITLDMDYIKSSSLVNKKIPIPLNKKNMNDIPNSYVPGRNTIFLSYAMSIADDRNIDNIYIGANQVDYSGYPDCRISYLKAYQKVLKKGTKKGVGGKKITLKYPLINLTKEEIIKRGIQNGLDYTLTRSCYNLTSSGISCGQCDSCKIRLQAFKKLGLKDNIKYNIDDI